IAGISPAALRRTDPGAGPALCLRLGDASAGDRGALLACAVPGRVGWPRDTVRVRRAAADRRARGLAWRGSAAGRRADRGADPRPRAGRCPPAERAAGLGDHAAVARAGPAE